MKHSHPTSKTSHNEPTKREPTRTEAKLPDRKATEPQAAKATNDDDKAEAAKAADKAATQPPADITQRSRENIAAIVDKLLAVVRAELDTDRLQGGPRNALTQTVEQLTAAKNELA